MQLNFKCEHCEKLFAKEKTLVVHICEQKRRHLSKNEKHVQMGLLTFQRFYELTQKAKQPKTFEEFASSSFYTAFVKFGSFMVNTAPIYPERFIDFVVKSGVKLDHWCRDALYDDYVVHLIKQEPVEVALERSISHMLSWANDNQAQWNHYFLYVSLNRAVNDIVNGKISCWVILNCNDGKAMVKNMSDDQLNLIAPGFDVPYWLKRFKELPADVLLVKEICEEVGLK